MAKRFSAGGSSSVVGGDDRTMPVPVQVRASELEQLRDKADAEGLTLSAWVRGRLGLPDVRRGRPPIGKMTLHDAMVVVLKGEPERTADAVRLAAEIGRRKLYQRGDGQPVPPSQLRKRADLHPEAIREGRGHDPGHLNTAGRLASEIPCVTLFTFKTRLTQRNQHGEQAQRVTVRGKSLP